MPLQGDITGEWLAAESQARAFTVAGGWGSATGVVTADAPRQRGIFRGEGAARRAVALVAPQWPGLEDDAAVALLDDALAMGLLDAGVRVARLRTVDWAGEPDVPAWLDLIGDVLQAVGTDAPAVGLAGSWLAGTACALVSARREDLAFLACAATPSAEVMSRRTPENEDDPAWNESPTLRLADRLAEHAPLEAVTVASRPALFVQGGVDGLLPVAHLEAWRAALSATGRPAEGIEVAFADAFMRPVDAQGATDHAGETARSLLRGAVGRWVPGALSRAPEARRGR